MKKIIRNRFFWPLSIITAIGATVLLLRYFSRKKSVTQVPTNTGTLIVGSGGGGSGTPPPGTAYNAFSIKKAYLDNSVYVPYASIEEALDKNLEDSGYTNQTGTVYANSMDSGNIAYADAHGDNYYPTGNYFYETTFEMLLIDQQGVMHFYNDIDKNGLNEQTINDGTV